MMTFLQALELAESWVKITTADQCVILKELTHKCPYGWVFFYHGHAHLASQDVTDLNTQRAPILVDRFSSEIRVLGTAFPLEKYLRDYEITLPLARLQTSIPEGTQKSLVPIGKLNHSVSGAVRQFSYWVANRTVGLPILEGVDYSCIFKEPSALEQTYAIFMNVLEVDENGIATNEKYAEQRVAQFIRRYVDASYTVDPPFEDWEVCLH